MSFTTSIFISLNIFFRILQFYLKLGCIKRSSDEGGRSSKEVLLVQYSSNGGVEWTTLQEFSFLVSHVKVVLRTYYVLFFTVCQG